MSMVPGGGLVDEYPGFLNDGKRLFKNITGGCTTEVSSSQTPMGRSRKPLALLGKSRRWVSPAHLTRLVRAPHGRWCLSPALTGAVGSWTVAPVSLCC